MTDKPFVPSIYPQDHWVEGRVAYRTDPFLRMNRQIELATEHSGDLPCRPGVAAVQLVHVDRSVRCYYTHPFKQWACQEPSFYQVLVGRTGEEASTIIPSCPEHLAHAVSLGVEMQEKLENGDERTPDGNGNGSHT